MIPQNSPAHQRYAAFTPTCFELPNGTALRKRTFHQGCVKPNGIATSRTSCRHTVCLRTRSNYASVSHEISSKSHASRLQDERFQRNFLQSLQNECFVRNFLQKSHVRSPKRAFRTRFLFFFFKNYQSLQNEHFVRDFLQKSIGSTHRSTHLTQPCQAISRLQPLQIPPAYAPIPMSQRHSPPSQLTTSRFLAPATNLSASTRLTRTK